MRGSNIKKIVNLEEVCWQFNQLYTTALNIVTRAEIFLSSFCLVNHTNLFVYKESVGLSNYQSIYEHRGITLIAGNCPLINRFENTILLQTKANFQRNCIDQNLKKE